MDEPPHNAEQAPDVASGPRPGDLIASKYRVDRLLGHGGMAVVYAGENVLTGKRVALKLLRAAMVDVPEAVARFRQEALAAGRIHHPSVVTVFDVVAYGSSTCLVMELLEGETLSTVLERRVRLPPLEAVRTLLPALRGVAAVHQEGVVHRDLKPDNIFICRSETGEPVTKVLDFGVSKLLDQRPHPATITVTGTIVGTPAYMAPEQVRGLPSDQRVDVYGCGVVLYESLGGRPPFTGDVYSAVMVDIATKDPTRLAELAPELPLPLCAIVERAMARDAAARFPSVEALVSALEAWLRTVTGVAVPALGETPPPFVGAAATETPLPAPPPRRRLALLAALGGVALLGVGAAAVLSRPSPPSALFDRPAPTQPAPHTSASDRLAPPTPSAATSEPPAATRDLEALPSAETADQGAARFRMRTAPSAAEPASRRRAPPSGRSAATGAVRPTAARDERSTRPSATHVEAPSAPAARAPRAGRLKLEDF